MTNQLRAKEGHLEVPGGRVWYKSVGEGDLPPLLVLHGGPGFTHNYLRALEDLADERQVIFWDQLGCGKSDMPNDVSLWTMDRSLREVDAVREQLGLNQHHMFGNSWGGILAQQYVLDRKPTLNSVILSNCVASKPRMVEEAIRLKSLLDPEVQETLAHHEKHDLYDCPEYVGAIAVWYRTYICRMKPWPAGLEASFAGEGKEIYQTMMGPSDFNVTGNLKNWDVMDRLGEISLPTLFVAGRYDECTPEQMSDMHERVPDSEFALFENSAHMPFEEEREDCIRVMRSFLQRHDAALSAVG